MTATFIFFHVVLTAAGVGVLRAIRFDLGSVAEAAGWGYLAGYPVYSMAVFTLLTLGVPLSSSMAWLVLAVLLVPLIYSLAKNRPKFGLSGLFSGVAGVSNAWSKASGMEKTFAALAFCLGFSKFAAALWFMFNEPPYFDDAISNWNLRAKNIFFEGGVFLDRSRGDVSFLGGGNFTHYPLLNVTYKSALAAVLNGWREPLLNMVHLLSPLAFVFVFICWAYRRSESLFLSTLFPFMVVSLPLSFLHLFAAYADLSVGLFSALTLICFADWFDNKNQGSLLGAGLFLFGAVFAKNDGIVIVWGVLTAVALLFALVWREWKLLVPSVVSFALLSPHTILRILYHLPLSPTRDDSSFYYRDNALTKFQEILFTRGSFGIFWFVLPVLLAFFAGQIYKSRRDIFLGMVLFGMLAGIFFIFSFTGMSMFLFNGMTACRTLMFFSLPSTVYLFLLSRQYVQNTG